MDGLTDAAKAIHLVGIEETMSEVPNKADFEAVRRWSFYDASSL